MNNALLFNDVLEHCKANNLFLGFGNPDGKVLMVGKEQAYSSKEVVNSPEFFKDILDNSIQENQKNISGWLKNINNKMLPDWENMPTPNEITLDTINPFYNWGSQVNSANRKKVINGQEIWNGGTSNTYLKYQKFYQYCNDYQKSERINFQKDFFITELSDIAMKYSYSGKTINEIRQSSIDKRKGLLSMPFFRKFPITIIAAGRYPKNHDIDLQKVFDVEYTNETIFVGKDWYNLHFSMDKKRILIHTRQLSMDVTDDLLKKIADECRSFL